jgi:hypothetical protein
MQAMAITATVWPILYAAVLGPLVKAIALYVAQRGTKLGVNCYKPSVKHIANARQVLEILFTSQTLVTTLRGCFTFRIMSFWPVILIVVWSLSPAGGQGALRAIQLQENTTMTGYPLSSYPSNNLITFRNATFGYGDAGARSLINQYHALGWAVFSAQDINLLHANGSSNNFEDAVQRASGSAEAVRMTQRDLWRNVRIPFLHLLPGFGSENDEWIEIHPETIPAYSSLIGVPIRGFPSAASGNITFTIQTNYQTLDVSANIYIHSSELADIYQCILPWVNASDWLDTNNDTLMFANAGLPGGVYGQPNLNVDMITDTQRPARAVISDIEVPTKLWPKLRLAIWIKNENLTVCEVGTDYVDAQVQCSRGTSGADLACFVEKMRRTPNTRNQANVTALDVGANMQLLRHVPYTLASRYSSVVGVMEKWLRDPPTTFQNQYPSNGNGESWYGDLPLKVFGDRFAVALNTHLRASLNMTNIVGSDGLSRKGPEDDWGQTTGTWVEFTAPVYRLNTPWFVLYLFSAIVLTACAFANIVLRTLIHVPDFISSISALTRDSPFVDVPTPGSTLDGTDRSRYLWNKRVIIQDVQPGDKIGRIAFTDAPELAPLQKERRYE